MNITFLSAQIPLTKSFTKKSGVVTKSSYPSAYAFTTMTETITSMKSFATALKLHAEQGHCLLKGEIQRPLNNESRANSTDANSFTDWVCLDVDGVPNCTAPEFMHHVGLSHVAHVIQYSASYLIENTDLKCHIFFQVDKAVAPAVKQWLITMNLNTQILFENTRLTKTGNSLHWPLDITASQNDKLLYIAPPVLKGIKEPIANRITYVDAPTKVFNVPYAAPAKNKLTADARIAELRAIEGLPAKKIVMKLDGPVEYMVKPDICMITEMKVDGEWVRFNLNGGDSWAYHHPINNPKYIYSFKGEPTYLTKELLPEYWASLQTVEATPTSFHDTKGAMHLMLMDRKTSVYYRGTYNQDTNELDLEGTNKKDVLKDYAQANDLFWNNCVLEWNMVFDPSDTVRVDLENRVINTFEPTQYMLAQSKVVRDCPKRIYKVIHNVVGSDADITKHMINWLAYIVQTRSRTCTSWVLHGTTGTGKGVLFHKILKPLFGSNQAKIVNMQMLDGQFNSFIQNSLLVFIDEVDSKSLNNEQGVMARMRTFITEENIPVRRMYSEAREAKNYANWICSSNKTTPVSIDREDRRTNVAKYQPNKLNMAQDEIDAIEGELQSFHDYLVTFKVDLDAVRTPINTSDRETLMSVSESSVDTVGSALLNGDIHFFIDQLPTSDAYKTNMMQLNKVEQYKVVLQDMVERMEPDGLCKITRDELHTLFNYTVGNMPDTPNKFTALLKHHRIHTTKIWFEQRSMFGIKTVWLNTDRQLLLKLISPPMAPPTKLKAVK